MVDVRKHGQPDETTIGGDGALTVYGNYIGGGGTKVAMQVPASEGAQTIAAGTWTTIIGWSVVKGDAAMLSGDTIKISEAGKYMIQFACGTRDAGTAGDYGVRLLLNGTTVIGRGKNPTGIATVQSNPAIPTYCMNSIDLSPGDTIEGQVKSLSGFDTPVPVNYAHPTFCIVKVSG